MELNWFEVENLDNVKMPKWKRSAAISSDGIVFIPSAIAGDEREVYLCTLYDRTPSATYLDHIYVPAQWLAKEFPDTKKICEFIELKIREFSDSELSQSDSERP